MEAGLVEPRREKKQASSWLRHISKSGLEPHALTSLRDSSIDAIAKGISKARSKFQHSGHPSPGREASSPSSLLDGWDFSAAKQGKLSTGGLGGSLGGTLKRGGHTQKTKTGREEGGRSLLSDDAVAAAADEHFHEEIVRNLSSSTFEGESSPVASDRSLPVRGHSSLDIEVDSASFSGLACTICTNALQNPFCVVFSGSQQEQHSRSQVSHLQMHVTQ
jgi:hypothetical protein